MSGPLFERSAGERDLDVAFQALRDDLVAEDGPRISTMRNYRFAIVPYHPALEFELRRRVQRLAADLQQAGWYVLTLSLEQLFHERITPKSPDELALRPDPPGFERLDAEQLADLIALEKEQSAYEPLLGLSSVAEELASIIEGPNGLAADCARRIAEYAAAYPERVERTVVLIGRVGALHPFLRSSALLRHLDGKTRNIPVVLLYPGVRRGPTGLSFMGTGDADHDYRPRIYP